MKREENDKLEMEELRKKIEEKKLEINDEIVPGSYFYDVDKVEELKNEINELNKRYQEIDAVPTKEIIENEKQVWDNKLEEIDKELKSFYQEPMYQKTEEIIELEEQRKEVKDAINEKQEILNVIDNIEKVEQELDDLHEEEEEYIGAFYIPDDLKEQIEEKENELSELNKKLEEFTQKRILDSKGLYHVENQGKDNKDQGKDDKDQGKDDKDQGKDNKDQGKDDKDKGKDDKDKGKDDKDKGKDDKDKGKDKDKNEETLTKITIGRKGSIQIGNHTYKISKEAIKEGIELDADTTIEIIEGILGKKIPNERKTSIFDLLEFGGMDSTVIQAISYIDVYSRTKAQMMKAYIDNCIKVSNNEKPDKSYCQVVYDQKSLSKTNIWSRIFRKEMNSDDKYKMLTKAQVSAINGLVDLEGNYNPNLISRIVDKVTRSKATQLLSDRGTEKVAWMFNETLDGKKDDIDYDKMSKREKILTNMNEKKNEFLKNVQYKTLSKAEKQELQDLKDWKSEEKATEEKADEAR